MVCSKDFFEILYNEYCQEVHGDYINGVSEKSVNWGQMGHFGWKMATCHNSGSGPRIFLKFFLMKGGKREVHEYDIHGFSDKKYYFWQKGHYEPKHGVTS